MTRDFEYARLSLDVAQARYAEAIVECGEDHPRTRDARESLAGWRREVARHERQHEDLATEGFDALVDKLMALNGYSRDEAELVAENIIRDDAA